jgi:putative sulfotransferase
MTNAASAYDLPICLVLSTGRCGSTVLSDVIAEHPDALSVSELFSSIPDHELVERYLDGAAFWRLLSRRTTVDLMMLRCGIGVDELRYPIDSPRPGASRFARGTGLPPPPIAQVTLPHMTDRPDDLFDRIGRCAVRLPVRPLSDHFRWLFRALGGDRRPAVAVERSGGSLAYTARLLRLFPDARVVHLYRDGRECALSMSRHVRYRMAMVRSRMAAHLGYDPYADDLPDRAMAGAGSVAGSVAGVAGLDAPLRALLPGHATRAAYDAYEIPLPRYGMVWSKMIIEGLGMLRDHPSMLSLDYRDLVSSPHETIGGVLEFLGLDRDPGCERRMVQRIRPSRDARRTVDEKQWHELTRACLSGMNRLYGRGGWN